MDSSDASQLFLLLVLLFLSAFFSSAETCLTTANKVRMQTLAQEHSRNAAIVLKLTENPSRLLSAILIGNNVVNLTASSLTTSYAIRFSRQHGLPISASLFTGITTGVLTIAILIFGEILPKSLAAINAEKLALLYARPVYALTQLLRPVSFLMHQISLSILKLLHVDTSPRPAITENELLTMVDVSHKEGVIEQEEREMITNVVDFGDSLAKDIMVPKMDIEFVDVSCTYQELMACYSKKKFTRMPVYQESYDNIIGIINLKDLFFYKGSLEDFQLSSLIREPYFTYEYKRISGLFFEMKQNSIPMAIVLDEYGATAGLLTIEDLVEEIVGEIRDEYDGYEEDEITMLDSENYVLLGVAKLDDIREQLGIPLESEDYDSIAGHIINLLDHFPDAGEQVSDAYAEYTILAAEKNRIDKVRIHLLPAKDIASEDTASFAESDHSEIQS